MGWTSSKERLVGGGNNGLPPVGPLRQCDSFSKSIHLGLGRVLISLITPPHMSNFGGCGALTNGSIITLLEKGGER